MPEPKWYRELTPYQWRVLVCTCLGWALDIMDGYLYAIILFPAMSDLLGTTESAVIGWYGGIVLSIFMIVLAGCATHRSAAHDECVAGGFRPGTSSFEDCLDVVA